RHHSTLHPFPTRRSSDLDADNTVPNRASLSNPATATATSAPTPTSTATAPAAVTATATSSVTTSASSGSSGSTTLTKSLPPANRSEEHTSELQSRSDLVC